MRRILLLLALAGCASAGSVPEENTPRQAAIFSSPETGTLMSDRPRASTASFTAPPTTVWLAVKKAYVDLGVPLKVENPAAHQIGNPDFFRSHQFAGQGMSALVNCGSGMTGPKADSYRIYMSLLSRVEPDGKGGTTVLTTFVPMGQDVAGGSTDRIPCGTTGRLEQIFLDHVQKNLSGS